MATVKFPQEMDPSPTIAGDDKLMIAKATTGEAMQATFDSAKQYLNITGIEVKAVSGGETEATAVVLSPGPDGQVRKMSGVTGWFKNAGGTPWLAPTTNDNSNWWDGTTWSLGSSVPLPVAPSTDIVEEGNIQAVQSDAVAKAIQPFGEVIENSFVEESQTSISDSNYINFGSAIITGHGQNVGVQNNVGAISIKIRPTYSASEVPTFVELKVRLGGLWNSPVVATVRVTDTFVYDVAKLVRFNLPTVVVNSENAELFVSFISDGRIGAYGSGATNPYGKAYYSTVEGGGDTPFEGGSGQLGMTFHKGEMKAVVNDESIEYIGSKLNVNSHNLPNVLLTSKVWLYPTFQYNIFNRNVVIPEYGDNISNYRLDYSGDTGQQFERCYRLDNIPVSLNKSLSLNILQGRTVLVTKNQFIYSTTAANGTGANRKVLIVGDSTVNGSNISTPLKSIFDADPMDITLIGTLGSAGVKHEGRGGWTIADYYGGGRTLYIINVTGISVSPSIGSRYTQGSNVYNVEEVNITGGNGYFSMSIVSGSAPIASGTLTKQSGSGDNTINYASSSSTPANPFYNPSTQKFDIGYYLTQTSQSLSSNDWIFFQLGINDVFNITTISDANTKVATMTTQLKDMIANIHAYNANIRIGLVVTFPPAGQDGFASNYNLGQLSELYVKTGLVTWQTKMLSEFDNDTAINSRTYLVSAHLNLDTDYNFPTQDTPVNSRNTTVIKMQNNGVHPSSTGYAQIADMYAGLIKYFG